MNKLYLAIFCVFVFAIITCGGLIPPHTKDANKLATPKEDSLTASQRELSYLIEKKLEKASSRDDFSRLYVTAHNYDLRATFKVVESKWDEWSITQIDKAKTKEELMEAKKTAAGEAGRKNTRKKRQFYSRSKNSKNKLNKMKEVNR